MFRIIILYFFPLTATAQEFNIPDAERSKIVWHDNVPNYFRPQIEEKATIRPVNNEIPPWVSKDPGLNLKYPRFLFNEESFPVWSEKPIINLNKPTKPLNDNTVSNKNVADKENYTIQESEGLKVNSDTKSKTVSFIQKSNTEEDIVRDKIFSLAKDTESDLDGKISIIDKTNNMYKHNTLYKLGFIVSYVNTTHNALKDLMRYVEKNKDSWDVLKILNAYVQIKKVKEFLIEMLSVLSFLQSRSLAIQPQPMVMEKKETMMESLGLIMMTKQSEISIAIFYNYDY